MRNREFVQASRALGGSGWHIIMTQIMPNVTTPLLIQLSGTFGGIILTEAGLSYLYLGVQLPNPSWGNMIAGGRTYLAAYPWMVIVPGVALMITVLGFNFLVMDSEMFWIQTDQIGGAGMEKDVLLRITDYVVEFKTENGTKQAINHLNLTIHKGESLGLVGEAGAGKTTTALGVLRLLPKHSAKIKSGIIEFHGEDMANFRSVGSEKFAEIKFP